MSYTIYKCVTCDRFMLTKTCPSCPNSKVEALENEPVSITYKVGSEIEISSLKEL